MLLFVVAAVGFTRDAERDDNRFAAWLAAGLGLTAVSLLDYLIFPSLYTQRVHVGDLLRLGSYLLILIGAVGEIRRLERAAAVAVVLEERRRIARDLHDGLTQELVYLAFQMRMLARDHPLRREIDPLASSAERALDESRRAIRTLGSASEQPFAMTFRSEVEHAAARYGTEAHVRIPDDPQVRPEVAEALLRVAHEAVVNAGRHGHADTIHVDLEVDGGVRLRVVDDGSGFNPETLHGDGFGLASMRERIETLGGELNIRSAPGDGTALEAVVR
jgi:signal transduction histidine kinase